MTEQPSAAQPRAPSKAGVSSAAIVMAAVAAVAGFNATQEGTKYRAYLDGADVPTICRGHTEGVHLGDTATPAQCDAFYAADMEPRMAAVLGYTPALAQHMTALEASGDFAFNAGIGRWPTSPMAAAFGKGQWTAGCNAFVGYITLYRAPRPVPGHRCVRNAKGALYCEAGGLVTRRLKEKALCLAGIGS